MYLTEKLTLKHHDFQEFVFIDSQGKRESSFSIAKLRKLSTHRVATIMRGDLENLILGSLPDHCVRTDVMIESLVQRADKVDVKFSDHQEKRYDCVIGADGIHSNVRHRIFGDEKKCSQYLGFQLAVVIQPRTIDVEDAFYSYSMPGKQAGLYPISKDKIAVLYSYRHPEKIVPNPKKTLLNVYADAKWVVPQLLSEISQSTEIYFSDLSQIKMSEWHQGRVVLIGDACHCLTLASAQGASMAMAGAYILSTLLSRHHNAIEKAFLEYESIMQETIAQKQQDAIAFINAFIPDAAAQIPSRNFFTRQFLKKIAQTTPIDEFCR